MTLADQTCVPCRGGVPPLTPEQIAPLAGQVPDWEVVEHHHITRTFPWPDYRAAVDFTVAVAELAEEQGHHPDLLLRWGQVVVTLWTHKIDGLAEADFVMAAKIDRLAEAAGRG